MKGDEYGTPFELFDWLYERFNFVLDPCTTKDNPLGTQLFYTKESDGLVREWIGPAVFMNPPYSKVTPWVQKAYTESLNGILTVGLLRYDPSTRWWNDWVRGKALVMDVPYRVRFRGGVGAYNFPSAIVIWVGDLAAAR